MVCSHMKAAYLSALFLISSLVSAQQLSKPALRANLEDFNNALTYTLPVPSYSQQVWLFGSIAEPCKYEAQQNGYVPGEMFVYNVTYNDCDIPYVFCIHRNAPDSASTYFNIFGKVPARMRQYIRTISFFPNGGGAYARGADIVMFGSHTKVGVPLHETMHASEYSDAFKDAALMADQTPWQNAYHGDSAVPDDYARTNQRENLAQHPMFVIYGDTVGDPKNLEPNYNRILQQQYVLRIEADQGKNQGKFFATSGVRCAFRHPFPRKVDTKVSKRTLIDRQVSALSTLDISRRIYEPLGITVIDPRTLPTGKALEITQCKFPLSAQH